MANPKDYHKSIGKELDIIKNRVRNLIGHWGDDGRYKEEVLKNVIKKFIPSKFNVGTGFVIKSGQNRGELKQTNQIDIIIYDSKQPTFFKEGDFVILTPDAVSAIIEVKANLTNQPKQKRGNKYL